MTRSPSETGHREPAHTGSRSPVPLQSSRTSPQTGVAIPQFVGRMAMPVPTPLWDAVPCIGWIMGSVASGPLGPSYAVAAVSRGWIMGFGPRDLWAPRVERPGPYPAGNSPQDCCILLVESPIHPIKKPEAKASGFFYGVDNGIRTHDLQSHNLTR